MYARPSQNSFAGQQMLSRKNATNRDRAEEALRLCEDASADSVAYDLIAPKLVMLSCLPELMYLVLDLLRLRSRERQAVGPDGRRFDDRTACEWWNLLRKIRNAVLRGEQRPPNYRKSSVSKKGGKGRRAIRIGNCEDRVQQRTLHEIASRLVDRQLAWFSVGFRPRQGTYSALALARDLVEGEGRVFARVEDIRAAFDSVRISRLRDVLTRIFQCAEFVERLLSMSQDKRRKGLVAGSALSPLMLNLYLHEFLDRLFARCVTGALYLRYADDLLFLAAERESVQACRERVAGLLQSAGMSMRGKHGPARTVDLRKESLRWLGFQLRVVEGRLVIRLTDEAYSELGERLDAAQREGYGASDQAKSDLKHWIAEQGPAWTADAIALALPRIRRILQSRGFGELYDESGIKNRCIRARAKWDRIRLDPSAREKPVSRIRLGS